MGIITGAVKKSKQKSKRFHYNFLGEGGTQVLAL